MEQIESKKKLKICYIPYYGYETGNYAFDKKFDQRWTNVLKKKLEAQGHSFATYDINTIKDSDYIISFDNTYFQNVRHFWNIWKAGKLGRTLHIDYEPPSAMIRIHSDKGLRLLSKLVTVMTYNDNVVDGKAIIKGVVGDYHEAPIAYKNDFSRRKLIGMVANNRNREDKIPISKWPSELYTERESIATYLHDEHGDKFDLYGDFWPSRIKTLGVVERTKKLPVLSKYKFIISYDSIRDQNGYISEKIFDVFKAKSVPVYLGASNITDYIPKECFIDRRDFKSNEELVSYLGKMTKKEYSHRIAAIEKYLKSDIYNKMFSSKGVADGIYDNFIRRGTRRINYAHALAILLKFTRIYKNNEYYSYDNFYYDTKSKALKDPVYYVDKVISENKASFVVYVHLEEGQKILVSRGSGGELEPVKLNKLDTGKGMYADYSFNIPYDDILKNKRISIYRESRGVVGPVLLRNASVIGLTMYDDNFGFKATRNSIVCTTSMKGKSSKVKNRLRAIYKKLNNNSPEIIYYPFIAEPRIANDAPFVTSNGAYSWEHELAAIADERGIKIHTPDKAKYKNVVGVIFFDNMFYHNLPALEDLHHKGLLNKTIYIDFEPPTGHAKKHEPESMKLIAPLFKSVVTYDDDLAGVGNFLKINVANFFSTPVKAKKFADRSFAIMVTNNTTPDMIIRSLNYWNNTDHYNTSNIKYHPKAIYHKRLEVVDFFHTKGYDFDLYGTGFPDKYSHLNKGFLQRNEKIKTMSRYKFAFTFDSYTNQNGYISEKIFDAFFARTVPIYLGADNVDKYIPSDCFIDMRSYKSYDDLYRYLSEMTSREYDTYVKNIERFLSSDQFKNTFSNRAIASRLMKAIDTPSSIEYDKNKAELILGGLRDEVRRIENENFIITRIDKEQVNKEWCFVISVKPPKDIKSSDASVYSLIRGRYIKAKTIREDHEELKGNIRVVIPYVDIFTDKKISYYVQVRDNTSSKLIFPENIGTVVNQTNYDDNHKFIAKTNSLQCIEVK